MSIQTGWHWWNVKRDAKIFVIGIDAVGRTWYRTKRPDGGITTLSRGDGTAMGFIPIPECTGWDWKPKELPKAGEKWLYATTGNYVSVRHVDDEYAFYVWDSGVAAGLQLDHFVRDFERVE